MIGTNPAAGSEPTDGPLTFEELQLAARNRGMPLEALRYDITPTGLHYLLIHFDIPLVSEDEWQLAVGGAVENSFALTLDEIRALPARTVTVTLECAGNGRARLSPRPLSQPWLVEAIGTARWTGVPMRTVLERARPRDGVAELVFTGSDRGVQGGIEHDYARSLSLDDASGDDVLLAYEMNGAALEPQHGYPLRLIVPGWYGMTSVKWLKSIEAVTEPFDGYQQATAYRFQSSTDEAGVPVSKIRVRALMAPPGIPDFFDRRRNVESGPVEVVGRAWSGDGEIVRVEFGVDGDWSDASLDAPIARHAWRGWRFNWSAVSGEHELSCRATDAAGNVQPLGQPWNYQGMGNNMAQTVHVTVRGRAAST
jgi:DMSO/TMAO reductase YedYZ molybdopterin-dependent catalytic subunit